MKLRSFGFTLALFIATAGSASADPKSTAEAVDKAVAAWMSAQQVQSAAVAVSFHGEVAGSYGHGWTPQEPHLLASLSKAITAVCVAKLIDEKKLALTDTLGKVLAKDFEKYGEPTDEKFKSITIEQLLTHHAGMEKNTFGKAQTIGEEFDHTIHTKLKTAPDTEYFYSDIGYLVLGFVAKSFSGEAYPKQCLPVLTEVGATGAIEQSLAERAPNGGWKVSALDYVKFLRHFDTNSNLLGPMMKAWLRAPSEGGKYSLGAQVRKTKAGVRLSHTGLVHHDKTHPLTGGSYFIVDEQGYAVVVIFSGENKDAVYNTLVAAINQALKSDEAPTPAGNTATPATAGNIGPCAGMFCAQIDGVAWKADDVIPAYTNFGGKPVYNFSARAYLKPTQFFTFNLFPPPDHMLKGAMPLERGKPIGANTGNYTRDPNPADIFENSFPFETGQVVIETYDVAKKTISGTFSGNAKNKTGKVLAIAGRFAGVPFDPALVK